MAKSTAKDKPVQAAATLPTGNLAETAAFLAAIGGEVRKNRAKRGMTRRQLAQASRDLGAVPGADRERRWQSFGQRAARDRARARSTCRCASAGDRCAHRGARRPFSILLTQVPESELPALAKEIGARGSCAPAVPTAAGALRSSVCAGPASRRSAGCSPQHLGWPFIELDRRVEEEYGASIPDLIEMAGTATFRRQERGALERVIAEHEAAIITTAGGIVSNPETYALLLRRTHTVWIKARPEEHMSRVMAQGDFRPMAQNRAAMADLVAILEARRADYARAEAEVDTSGDAVEQSFAKLLRIVTPFVGRAVAMTLADEGFLDLPRCGSNTA